MCDRYHIELVRLLALCTMGKNVYTEIKCHSLLTLDDIVAMVSHKNCIAEVSAPFSLSLLVALRSFSLLFFWSVLVKWFASSYAGLFHFDSFEI